MLCKLVIVTLSVVHVLTVDRRRQRGEHAELAREPKEGLLIFVRDRMGDVASVEVPPDATVDDLKVAAQSADVNLHGCTLTFGGIKLLDPSALLSEVGLSSESVVDVSDLLPSEPAIYWDRCALYELNPIFEAEIRIESGKDKDVTKTLFVQWTSKSTNNLRVERYDNGYPLSVDLTMMCTATTGEWIPIPKTFAAPSWPKCDLREHKEQMEVAWYLDGEDIQIVRDKVGHEWKSIEVDMTEHVYKQYNKLQIEDLSGAKLKGKFNPSDPGYSSIVEWSVTLKSVVQPKQSELHAFISSHQIIPHTLKQILRKFGLMNFQHVFASEGYGLEKLAYVEPAELTKLGIAEELGRQLIACCRGRMEFSRGRPAPVPQSAPAIFSAAAAGAGPYHNTVEGVLQHLGISDCIPIFNAERYEFDDLPGAEPEELKSIGLTPEQIRILVTYFRPTDPAYTSVAVSEHSDPNSGVEVGSIHQNIDRSLIMGDDDDGTQRSDCDASDIGDCATGDPLQEDIPNKTPLSSTSSNWESEDETQIRVPSLQLEPVDAAISMEDVKVRVAESVPQGKPRKLWRRLRCLLPKCKCLRGEEEVVLDEGGVVRTGCSDV